MLPLRQNKGFLILSLIIIYLLFNIFHYFLPIKPVSAEDIISIVPGSGKFIKSEPFAITRFFDIDFFPTKKNQNITWYNDDESYHKISVRESNSTQITESKLLKPKESFSYSFNVNGRYDFVSPIYKLMNGSILVTDDLITKSIVTQNNVKIQLTYTPSKPKEDNIINYKLIFIDKNTNKNKEHIDYQFLIINSQGKTVYNQSMHSSWGMESARYKYEKQDGYVTPIVRITGISFQPVVPEEAVFK